MCPVQRSQRLCDRLDIQVRQCPPGVATGLDSSDARGARKVVLGSCPHSSGIKPRIWRLSVMTRRGGSPTVLALTGSSSRCPLPASTDLNAADTAPYTLVDRAARSQVRNRSASLLWRVPAGRLMARSRSSETRPNHAKKPFASCGVELVRNARARCRQDKQGREDSSGMPSRSTVSRGGGHRG